MKKLIILAMLAVMTFSFIPVMSSSSVKEVPAAPAPKPADKNVAEVNAMVLRLNEINAMDKSKLTSKDKKNLHKEVKSIQKRMKAIGGNVYIPVIAIILVVVLLIVLL